MKKKICIVLIAGILLLSMSACKEQDSKKTENDTVQENQEVANEESIHLVRIYYVNQDSLEITEKEQEIKGDLSEGIISSLIKEGVLTEACQVMKVEADKGKKEMTIDINSGFGDYIRSMGTAGETEILECTTRTYLDAYQCEKIKITEGGQALETGHTVIEDYISY